jgi:CheY-like chemotaxis protein
MEAIGQLTGGIAHDFNNLMTVIAGSADFLRRNRNLPEAKKLSYLDGIIETAGRATKLTSQLLTFGRRQAIKPRVLNVAQRLTAAQQLLGRTLGSKFKLEIAVSDPDLKIEVDEAQFEAAIVNAVVNARDAMPNGGTITLSAATEQRDGNAFVRVSISDTGLGMPERVKERAFDPFFTTKEVGKGTGLGLSQIHGFAAQAGGIAEIDTEEGNGTTIALLIPQSTKPLDQPGVPADPLKALPSLKILLVEDNDPVRAFTHDMLRDAGCNVIEASNASQALQLLDDSEQFDLMLADVVMPGQSGIELANQVRELRPNLPIVLVTGYSDELARGGVEYPCIAKPFTSTELRAAMESVLARP